ncbi:hypothetical protein Tco_0597020 [Tanacetum coccineum]
MKYDEKTGVYSCQVDEQWFDLSVDLLRKALAITPVDPAHPFELPLSGNTVIDFVNQLGYPEPEKASGLRKGSRNFSHTRRVKSQSEGPKGMKGNSLSSFLMDWFSKVTIYLLVSNHNIHRPPDSVVHHTGDDFLLGNLKFVPKGETVEVFGMAIPDPLITEAIQQSSYYPKYLEMVAKNTKKTPQESARMPTDTKRAPQKNHTTTTYSVKPSKPALLRQETFIEGEAHQQPEPQGEGDDPDLELAKKMSLDEHQEKREGGGTDADLEKAIKLSLDPSFLPQGQPPVRGVAIRDPVSETIPKLPEVVGKGKAKVTEEQAAHFLVDLSKKKSTTYQFILVKRDQAPHDSTTGPSSQPEDDTSEKVVQESSSTTDSERTESGTDASAPKVEKEQGEVTSSTVTSGVVIPVQTEDQAGSDAGKAHEALAGPDPEPMQEDQTGSDSRKEHVSLAGPNPEHMDEDFYATAYPKVHENLKLRPDEHVIEENPESHSGSMSSMKNLEDTDTYGDLFLNDKLTEDDHEKTNVADETKTDTSTPPVTAPIVEISFPKPSSQLDMAEVKKTDHSAAVLASIESQVLTVYSGLHGPESRQEPESSKRPVSEKSHAEIIRVKKEQEEQRPKSSYTIKATDTAALKEFDLKTALFKTMNENKSANRNTANYHLYHALMEALIEDENAMDREVADKVKDHKRKHDSDDDEDDDDDEGPSAGSNQGKSAKRKRPDSGASGSAQPPPKDDDQSSKKPWESDASASKQHPALTSTGWQITDTRDAVVDSSMHRSDPESEHSEQSSDDIPMQDEGHVSDLEDTDNAHIPKVSTTTWFKPIPEGERPATPEPEWTIPPNDFLEPENNWANTYATTYQVPAENKLQRKTYDIGSFIKWFCRRTGKKKLCKADLEGPAFNLVKAFHKNNVFLQYQMDECHKLLTNKVDLVNPEGHQILRNIYEPLPLGGPPETRKWSEDDKRKEQRLHHSDREKTTDQEDLSKSGKLCWRKEKRFDYRLIIEQRDDFVIQ